MNTVVVLLSTWLIASTSTQKLPVSFDARLRWPNCPSIAIIPDQGCCNASFALVPAAVITDRVCIQSNGNVTRVYSAFDAIACCTDCPFSQLRKCAGGDPVKVWNYWATTGLVSDSCMPYAMPPLCLGFNCPLLCAPGSTESVTGDRRTGLGYFQTDPSVPAIQYEILLNGPVEASIDLYPDFRNLANLTDTDIYGTAEEASLIGRISVKILGWGKQNGTDYWLISTTFGKLWGFQGTVKIPLGTNFLKIETSVRAGIPNV